LHNIQSFLDDTRGQITIGEIPPIRRAALAAEGKKARVAPVCRDDETVAQLLERLDIALGRWPKTPPSTRSSRSSNVAVPGE
jgi:hypothetical protein